MIFKALQTSSYRAYRLFRIWRRRNTDLHPVRSWLDDFFRDVLTQNVRDFLHERTLLVWLLALIIGVAVAYAAILFRFLIRGFHWFWLNTTDDRVYEAALAVPWYVILLAPVVGGILVGAYLQFVIPGRRAQGVADVIESRAVHDCQMPLSTGLSSALVAALSLGFGASAGREGPVVHLGATLAANLQRAFDLPLSAQRTLLGAGVAAAISASFNAPLAGVLFAHEVILAHYALRAFVPIVIASVTAAVIAHLHLGNVMEFVIPDFKIASYWEFPAFALLGVVAALVAIFFQFSLIFSERVARSITVPIWVRPIVGGVLVGLIALIFPQVLGVGYDSTDLALKQQFSLSLLLALIVAKSLATAITLASRFGGGVFSPALYLGAMTGGAFGLIAAGVFPQLASEQGLYSLIGMGAVAAAVLGAPISTTLIVFELTGGYDLTIAVLLSVSIATALMQAVHGASFFHWQLMDRGLFLQNGQHRQIVRSIKVSDFYMELGESDDVQDISEDLAEFCLQLDDNAELALRHFDQSGLHRLPVVLASDPTRLAGWADHMTVLHAINQALIATHVEEHR